MGNPHSTLQRTVCASSPNESVAEPLCKLFGNNNMYMELVSDLVKSKIRMRYRYFAQALEEMLS
jgi:hypothetical protein